MRQTSRIPASLSLERARALDGIWVAAGFGDAQSRPPTPLGWELVLDDATLFADALARRGAPLSRKLRSPLSIEGHPYHAFVPMARAARELAPLDAEALSLAIACEARDIARRELPSLVSPKRRELARLVHETKQRLLSLRTRVLRHEQDGSQHYRWFVEMDLGILPDDALKTTLSECFAIQKASRALEIDVTLDLAGAVSALIGLGRRARAVSVRELLAAALVPDALELTSATPALALVSLLASTEPARRFSASFGELGPRQREPSTPRWQESLPLIEPMLELLRDIGPGELGERRTAARRSRSACVARAVACSSVFEATLLEEIVATVRAIVTLRSRLHWVRARTLSMLRSVALDVDRRLGRLIGSDPEAVFFLERSELLESTLRPDLRLREVASARRSTFREQAERKPPPAVLGQAALASDASSVASDPALLGLGVGLGGEKVTARATVASSFDDALSLTPGGILVVRSLDAGWGPIVSGAGAIVTDAGGLTDEGVLTALSLGVPLVIGAGNVTERVTSGQLLSLDPRAGSVSRA
jgi:pyruvate,water dikinase